MPFFRSSFLSFAPHLHRVIGHMLRTFFFASIYELVCYTPFSFFFFSAAPSHYSYNLHILKRKKKKKKYNNNNNNFGMVSSSMDVDARALPENGTMALTTEVLEASLLKKSRGVPGSGVSPCSESSPLAAAEPLPEEIPLEALKKMVLPSPAPALLPPVVVEITNGCGGGGGGSGDAHGHPRKFVMGRNMHGSCLQITEPELDDKETGEKEAYMSAVLAQYKEKLIEKTKFHLGYPYNLDFNYGALAELQHFSINNLGDPFIESNYGVHSRQFEVGVLDWFAHLWELEKDEYWGYITNCGTEGNLHGILLGREVLPDGILYASRDSHYSVFKAARMYRMEAVKVDTLLSGEINCDDFRKKLTDRKDKPAILNINVGTTVKGAVDDLDLVIQILKEVGYTEDRFYIHIDGALFGLMIPFVKRAPKVSFKKPIGSVSVSGHKFMGCPMPCGVQITRMKHINMLSRNVEYLASRDATIMGSRNGHAPIFLWYTLNHKGYRGFQKEVQRCIRNAHYLTDCLREANFGVMLNELSSTVVFERPQSESLILKWQLACQGKIAHAVIMPSVTVEKLDAFIVELIQARNASSADGNVTIQCIVEEVGANNCACSLHRGARVNSWTKDLGMNGVHKETEI